MHIWNHDHAATCERRIAPSAEGMGGRAALWIAAAIGLALVLNATSVRVLAPVEMPDVTQSD